MTISGALVLPSTVRGLSTSKLNGIAVRWLKMLGYLVSGLPVALVIAGVLALAAGLAVATWKLAESPLLPVPVKLVESAAPRRRSSSCCRPLPPSAGSPLAVQARRNWVIAGIVGLGVLAGITLALWQLDDSALPRGAKAAVAPLVFWLPAAGAFIYIAFLLDICDKSQLVKLVPPVAGVMGALSVVTWGLDRSALSRPGKNPWVPEWVKPVEPWVGRVGTQMYVGRYG
ncbi:hypothetical protein MFIFM68171_02133 [Madurella fahalii]|uniref:Uncharacterized protein n=1 Tax=Madurella fahalii TaxID=1157608 RepID=A0ABQ0G2D4_9PEZI